MAMVTEEEYMAAEVACVYGSRWPVMGGGTGYCQKSILYFTLY